MLGVVLLLFELVLIARMVVDWVGVLSPEGGRSGLIRLAVSPTASPSP